MYEYRKIFTDLHDRAMTDATLGSFVFGTQTTSRKLEAFTPTFTLVLADQSFFIEENLVLTGPFSHSKWLQDIRSPIRDLPQYQPGGESDYETYLYSAMRENKRIGYQPPGILPSFNSDTSYVSDISSTTLGLGKQSTRIAFRTYNEAYDAWCRVYGRMLHEDLIQQIAAKAAEDDMLDDPEGWPPRAFDERVDRYRPKFDAFFGSEANVRTIVLQAMDAFGSDDIYAHFAQEERELNIRCEAA